MNPNEPEDVVVETPQETLTRVHETLAKTKAWALAKAQTVASRIRDAGGEPTAEVAELLAAIETAAK